MATQTNDYEVVIDFINRAKMKDCYIRDSALPEPMQGSPEIPYLGLGLSNEYNHYCATGFWRKEFQIFASGWTQLEGIMIITPEQEFDADVRVGIAATNERAFRDLLLSFPRGKVGFFYCAGEWTLKIFAEILDGYAMPSREGYFATQMTFHPIQSHPVMKLGKGNYEIVQAQWSKEVWERVLRKGYSVHACYIAGELRAMCFHWKITDWRNEVHGLQAVKDFTNGYAESVFSSATQEVLEMGRLATCTANLSSDVEFLKVLHHIGYRPFYRIHSYRGIKRGSGCIKKISLDTFFGKCRRSKKVDETSKTVHVTSRPIVQRKKDPIISEFRDLISLEGKLELKKFVIEGVTLVKRAIHDGLPVERILYIPDLLDTPEGLELLNQAHVAQLWHSQVSKGLMGTVTKSRPVPSVVASVWMNYRDSNHFHLTPGSVLLIVDSIANPDNLGMVIRTADAAGVEGVLIIGEAANPFHKNCVRAARGAVGRIPLLYCKDSYSYLRTLIETGFDLLGATSKANRNLYSVKVRPPLAFIVGSESAGIRQQILNLCTKQIRIPMAPGQSSLNVGVATGILLYELVRHRVVDEPSPLTPEFVCQFR